AINDEKLKKDEIKITVIASGFPQDVANESPHIPSDGSMLRAAADGGVGKIYNSLGLGKTHKDEGGTREVDEEKTETEVLKKEERKPEPPKRKEKIEKEEDENSDDDDWGSIPSFLRRSKIR